MENEIRTKCQSCLYNPTCHRDAKDPDCWPYGPGCDEYTFDRAEAMANRDKVTRNVLIISN